METEVDKEVLNKNNNNKTKSIKTNSSIELNIESKESKNI